MSKTETIAALMQSATRTFAKDGYEGASLRDIASAAEVPLSTIHLYFSSKSDLFLAVWQAAWGELDRERHAILDRALSARGDTPPVLADIFHALAYPVARRALSRDPHCVAQISVLRRWQPDVGPSMIALADHSMVRWIEAMRLCRPTLTQQDAAWALSFVIGAIYSWQLIDHRYDTLIGPEDNRSAEEVTASIVAFCCGGLATMADHLAASSS